jgi:hypothetical protein
MSCLFDSLSRFINIESVDGTELRRLICDFLQTNPLLIDDMSTENIVKEETNMPLEQYINFMRQHQTFGGAIEIRAFTKLFKINVMVKSLPNRKDIEFIENSEYMWAVISWNGGHFEAIQ